MSLKGFSAGFKNSKIASRKILSDSAGNLEIDEPGHSGKTHIGLASKTRAAVNPTTDEDDTARAVGGGAPQANGDDPMIPSSRGGASGDGPTPGYIGSGTGVDSLKGAAGNGVV